MHIGYREPEYDDGYWEEDTSWGSGSPLKVGLLVRWDSLAFWRKVPHKHVKSRYEASWHSLVNARCDRCLRWYVLATGKLNKEANERDKL